MASGEPEGPAEHVATPSYQHLRDKLSSSMISKGSLANSMIEGLGLRRPTAIQVCKVTTADGLLTYNAFLKEGIPHIAE